MERYLQSNTNFLSESSETGVSRPKTARLNGLDCVTWITVGGADNHGGVKRLSLDLMQEIQRGPPFAQANAAGCVLTMPRKLGPKLILSLTILIVAIS